MSLYKRVFPKWAELFKLPAPVYGEGNVEEEEDDKMEL